jgi:NADPH-dependent glutamate synthase beta subunit-like oxidoreductase
VVCGVVIIYYGDVHVLSLADQAVVAAAAIHRHDINQAAQSEHRDRYWTDGHDPLVYQRRVIGAEVAAVRLTGSALPALVRTTWRDTCDFILPDGRTVDVKVCSTEYVYVTPRKGVPYTAEEFRQRADIYMALVGTFPRYRFMGWKDKADIIRQEHWCTTNVQAPCYRVRVRDLRTVLDVRPR